jgi:hypothetical protein
MPIENRGAVPPEAKNSSSWKKKLALSLGLAGALGGAVESGKLGIKQAGAEKDEMHQVEGKKQKEVVDKSFTRDVAVPMNAEAGEDVVGKNYAAAEKFLLNNDVVESSYTLEPREDENGNLNCDVYMVRPEEGQKDKDPVSTNLRITINKNGTYTIHNFSEIDKPTTVSSIEDLAKQLENRRAFQMSVEQYREGNYSREELEGFAKAFEVDVELPTVVKTTGSSTLPTGKINPAD